MKIKLMSGEEIDTFKLNDKSSEIHEKMHDLYETCKKYNVTIFSRILLEKEMHIGMLYLPDDTEEIKSEQFTYLIEAIGDWLMKTTDGDLRIVQGGNFQ
jgi:hypothetical protein